MSSLPNPFSFLFIFRNRTKINLSTSPNKDNTFHLEPTLWKDQIPYIIEESHPLLSLIEDSINILNQLSSEHNLKILWVPFNSQVHKNVVAFILDDVCSSSIGYKNDHQKLCIAKWADKGNILHEMGHCMGLTHEHMRPGRKRYVEGKMELEREDELVDMQSIMFYRRVVDLGEIDFCSITKYEEKREGIGERRHFSVGDINYLKYLYGGLCINEIWPDYYLKLQCWTCKYCNKDEHFCKNCIGLDDKHHKFEKVLEKKAFRCRNSPTIVNNIQRRRKEWSLVKSMIAIGLVMAISSFAIKTYVLFKRRKINN